MSENEKLDLMKKFKELNVAEYTIKYGDYYGLMFAGAEIATKELQKENAELKEYNKYLKRKRQGGVQKQYNKVAIIKQQKDQLAKAKELIENIIRVTWGEGWNYSLDWKVKAEDFIKE